MSAQRISAAEARRKASTGEALLVCAYKNEQKYKDIALDGSIPLQQLESQLDSVPKDAAIIFY